MKRVACERCGKPVELPAEVESVDGFNVADDPIARAWATFEGITRPFCNDACELAWSRAEVARLRGWLRRIFIRSHGVAGRIARKALNTNLRITDDV